MRQETIWQSPGPASFLSSALNRLETDRMMAVQAPDRIQTLIPDAIEEVAFERNRVRSIHIDMKAIGGARSPLVILSSRIHDGRTARVKTTKDLLDLPNVGDRTVIVRNLDRDTWSLWSGFCASARMEAADNLQKLPRMIVMVPANVPHHEIVDAFGRQGIHKWEGITDRMDLELWANSEHGPATGIMERLARETSLELAGPNLFLLRELLGLEEDHQLDPWDILSPAATEFIADKTATWRDGMVDRWDEAVRVDTLILVARGERSAFDKRLWRAQSRILMPFIEDIRSMIVRRHKKFLEKQLPWDHPHFNNRNTRHHVDEFDVRDLNLALKQRLHRDEKDLLMIASKEIANNLAHMSPVPVESVAELISLYDTVANPAVEPGWDWPDTGQKLVMLVGSPAAGKTTWAHKHYPKHEIVSSDDVRASSPRFEGRGKDGLVFAEVRRRVAGLLCDGLNAVVDATHLKAEDRAETRDIVPRWMRIEYVVVDRPLEDKIRDQDWRVERGENFVKEMHERFQGAKDEILAGDGDPRVSVKEVKR